jgi:F420-non-reducing hydrogenase iron-sulfur subunit
MTGYEPRLIGFLCNCCGYAVADLAGISRIQYPTNISFLRLMCCRRLDPSIVLEALSEGVDGVMITTCSLGGCNFIRNHEQVEEKIRFTKRLLEKAGFEPERVTLEYLFASEGRKFADQVDKFIESVRALGPSPVSGDSPDKAILLNLRAAKSVAENYRMRALVGKEEKLVKEGNIYGEQVTQVEFDKVMDEALENEYVHQKIRLTLLEEPASVKRLSEKLAIDSREVLRHIVAMRQLGWVDVKETLGSSPIYMAQEVPE